ncbi:hypothetical protein AAVH_27525, partial [Aphelenchoides avenae]
MIQTSFQAFTLHSTLNALAMIALTRPYRETVLGWLHLHKPAKTTAAPSSTISPRASTLHLRRATMIPTLNADMRRDSWRQN